jgi:hypothetical protein
LLSAVCPDKIAAYKVNAVIKKNCLSEQFWQYAAKNLKKPLELNKKI